MIFKYREFKLREGYLYYYGDMFLLYHNHLVYRCYRYMFGSYLKIESDFSDISYFSDYKFIPIYKLPILGCIKNIHQKCHNLSVIDCVLKGIPDEEVNINELVIIYFTRTATMSHHWVQLAKKQEENIYKIINTDIIVKNPILIIRL